MKKYIVICIMLLAAIMPAWSHSTVNITAGSGVEIYGIINYERNTKGFWDEKQDFSARSINGIAYALDSSTNSMFVKTMTGNYRVNLPKDDYKIYKKQGTIKEYKNDEVYTIVDNETRILRDTYTQLNLKRNVEIRDSINQVSAVLEREREKENEKLRRDNAARSVRNANILPTGGLSFKCQYCSHEERNAKNLKIKGVTGDNIYHLAEVTGPLGANYDMIHVYKARADLKASKEYQEHLRLFHDDIVSNTRVMSEAEIKKFNKDEVDGLRAKITKIAPDGYIDEMILDCNNGKLTVEIYYTNSSSKTMSSIEVTIDYYTPQRDYQTATFTLSGPVKSFETAEYVNERTAYPCCSDKIENIKVKVNYSDGTKVEMSGDDVKINNG